MAFILREFDSSKMNESNLLETKWTNLKNIKMKIIRLEGNFCEVYDPEYLFERNRKIGTKMLNRQVTKEEIQMVNNHLKRVHH